jgi:hypothetical protein
MKDIGNMSTYYQKALNKIPSTTNKKRKKPIKISMKIKLLYTFYIMQTFGIGVVLRPLFGIK